MIYTAQYDSPIGPIIMAGDGESLTGLWFVGQKYFGSTLPGGCSRQVDGTWLPELRKHNPEIWRLPVFQITKRWLDIYFRGGVPDFTPHLHLQDTDFRMAVWEILLSIPYGQTMTYGEIAGKIAEQRGFERMSAQAVGNAVGHNPIGIIVPCHRVVGNDGRLIGYAGGLEKKEALLALEQGCV